MSSAMYVTTIGVPKLGFGDSDMIQSGNKRIGGILLAGSGIADN